MTFGRQVERRGDVPPCSHKRKSFAEEGRQGATASSSLRTHSVDLLDPDVRPALCSSRSLKRFQQCRTNTESTALSLPNKNLNCGSDPEKILQRAGCCSLTADAQTRSLQVNCFFFLSFLSNPLCSLATVGSRSELQNSAERK